MKSAPSQSPALVQSPWNVLTRISEAAKFASLTEAEQRVEMVRRIIYLEWRAKIADIFDPPSPTPLQQEVLDMVREKRPPILFRGIREDGNPVEWLKDKYARWLTAWALTQKQLKAIDPKLYAAFHNYCRDHKNEKDATGESIYTPTRIVPANFEETRRQISQLSGNQQRVVQRVASALMRKNQSRTE